MSDKIHFVKKTNNRSCVAFELTKTFIFLRLPSVVTCWCFQASSHPVKILRRSS